LPPLRASYRDFVSWQRDMIAGPQGQALDRYWSAQLAGELPVLHLRSSRVRPARPSHTGGLVPLSIEPDLLKELRTLARNHRTTLFSVVLLAWSTLLARESGQAEVIVGTPVSGRTRPEWTPLVGYFVNMLPLRVRVDAGQSFASQLSAVTETVREALEHQDFPFSLMVERLRVRRDAAHAPLFQTMLNVQRAPRLPGIASLFEVGSSTWVPFGDSRLEPFPITQQEGQFDWVLELAEFEESLQGHLKYNDDVGTIEDARRLAGRFKSLLREITFEAEARDELAF
jgi:non-ribosomal peptide synthetase component F